MRTTTEVIQDHLMKRLEGKVEEDIAENFSKDVILLSSFGTFRGHEGIKKSAEKLDRDMHGATFTYNHTQIEDDYALLEWSATLQDKSVTDGADSFVVKDGKIILQTVHYSPGPA